MQESNFNQIEIEDLNEGVISFDQQPLSIMCSNCCDSIIALSGGVVTTVEQSNILVTTLAQSDRPQQTVAFTLLGQKFQPTGLESITVYGSINVNGQVWISSGSSQFGIESNTIIYFNEFYFV